MLNDKFESNKDENGYIVIERDGEMFKYILKYLQTGIAVIPNFNFCKYVQLQIECDFYRLPNIPIQISGMFDENTLLLFDSTIYRQCKYGFIGTFRHNMLRERLTHSKSLEECVGIINFCEKSDVNWKVVFEGTGWYLLTKMDNKDYRNVGLIGKPVLLNKIVRELVQEITSNQDFPHVFTVEGN